MRLYYQEKGNGYPLIFLHGNGEDHKYFDAQVKYFSRYFKTIAMIREDMEDQKEGKNLLPSPNLQMRRRVTEDSL